MTEADLRPYRPRCEERIEPMGVDELSPRLSWRLASQARGDHQTAYRIQVWVEDAAPPGGRSEPAVLWDSGKVESAETLHIAYGGPRLEHCRRYRWEVRVWDAAGRPAGRTESWFETGLPAAVWTAAWIGRDPLPNTPTDPPEDDPEDRPIKGYRLPPCPHLRRRFELDRAPVRARLYCSARGLYRPFLNGRRVGDEELSPGWTEYHHRIGYQTYDVTDLVGEGANALGVLLGEGWWSGYVGMDPRQAGKLYGDAPAFIGQLLLEFADGARHWIRTDASWLESPGPVRWSDLLMGEGYDSRFELGDWAEADYDDSTWRPAAVHSTDTSTLVAQTWPPVRVLSELPAERIVATEDGRTIVDLGQNIVGRVRLRIRGAERGQRIVLRHAEMLDADGALYRDNLRRADATDVHVAAGRDGEVFEPVFTVHGFRYVEISGIEVDAGDVVGRVVGSDLVETGEFACDDDLVNRLYRNIRAGQRGNFVSVPTDCPQRDERLGWLGDAQVFLPTAARNADVSTFFAGWMRDVRLGQTSDGAFGDVAPKVCILREGAPGWGDAGVLIPWELYRRYGDLEVLSDAFESMVGWVEHVRRHNPDLIWRHRTGSNYGDWLNPGARTPRPLIATAYFHASTRIVARVARILDDPSRAQVYEDLAARIWNAFIAEFVDKAGRVSGDTQTGYLLALRHGLLPDGLEKAAADHLVADIEARDRHLSTGFLGVPLLCPVLTELGRADLAHALLTQRTYPGWLYQVLNGATTIWERWDGWTQEHGFASSAMNSFNHYSLGAVGDWLFGGVAGIEQAEDSVAYRRLVIRPHPGAFRRGRAAQETPRGRVETRWSVADDEIRFDVEIPPGVSASVWVPTDDPAAVTESGEPVAQPSEIGGGRYRFTAPWTAGGSPTSVDTDARS